MNVEVQIDTTSTKHRANITLNQLDQVVKTPEEIQKFLEANPSFGVNQVFNVTPHSVEGMDWTSSLLQRACSHHHVDSVQYLLTNGADPNHFRDAVEDINSIPPITLCVLHAISPAKREKALKNMHMLVAHGAYINRETECSSYPLECAAAIAKNRERRSMWELALFLVEHGAVTRHLAPNLFSNPPKELVEQLQQTERERSSTMSSLLTFALQCTDIPRAQQQQKHHMLPCSSPSTVAHSPFARKAGSPPQTPSRRSMGPLAQLGLISPDTPTDFSMTPVTPHTRSTPHTPQHQPNSITYSYTTPTANLSRKRAYAQMPPPRAPFSKLKASGVGRSDAKSSSRRHSKIGVTTHTGEVLQFVTPTHTVRATATKRTYTQAVVTESPCQTTAPCQTPLKRRRTAGSTSASTATQPQQKLGSIQVPTDVQRTILEFAMPVLHADTRRKRISSMLRMKVQRCTGAPLSQWLNSEK